MKCVEDQIKDNMGFGQGVTEWVEMDVEGVGGRKERESEGWRKAWVRLRWGEVTGGGVIEQGVMRQEGAGERLAG